GKRRVETPDRRPGDARAGGKNALDAARDRAGNALGSATKLHESSVGRAWTAGARERLRRDRIGNTSNWGRMSPPRRPRPRANQGDALRAERARLPRPRRHRDFAAG